MLSLGLGRLGLGLVARWDVGGARFARLGWVGRGMAEGLDSLASARPPIIDLKSQNVVIFCQKVAWIKLAYGRKRLPNSSLDQM